MSTQVDEGVKTFEAGEAITQYARVKLNSSGKVVEADADDRGIGTAEATTANAGLCPVRLWSRGTHKVIAAGAFSVNDILYAADEGQVDDVVGTGMALGRAVDAATAASDVVELIPLDEHTGLVYSNTADSAAVTNTTTETAFDKSRTIDGGELQVGDVIEVEGLVNVPNTNSTDTLSIKLKFGTEVVLTTTATDVADNDVVYFRAAIVIRSLGASGTIAAMGQWSVGALGTATMRTARLAQATEDISGDVAITATATWSVANAGNSCDLELLTVKKFRQ